MAAVGEEEVSFQPILQDQEDLQLVQASSQKQNQKCLKLHGIKIKEVGSPCASILQGRY